MGELIGVFGGTFDPPHLGHLILAAEALNQLQLDRLLWVLTPDPPHKSERAVTPLLHRIEMLRRAISDTPNFALSTVEIDRPGPHYTIDTLDLLQEQNPSAGLVLLVGGDSLRDLPQWHRPHEIVFAARLLGVMRRPDDSIRLDTLESALPGIKSRVRFVETPQLEISSSTIRQRVAEGGHFRYYLHSAVYEYILQNGLYRRA